MRLSITTSLAAAALLLVTASPAAAVSGGSVRIVLTGDFATGAEAFDASGGFCASGSAVTSGLRIVGGPRGLTFHLRKTLTCDDGSGSLVIAVDAATSYGNPGGDQGGWSIVSGTDRWATASGGGAVRGTYVPNGVIDTYTGVIR
jgi:hypothetical protein